jgi:hypothetical protein
MRSISVVDWATGRLGHSVYISRHAYNRVARHAQLEYGSLAASAVCVLLAS